MLHLMQFIRTATICSYYKFRMLVKEPLDRFVSFIEADDAAALYWW